MNPPGGYGAPAPGGYGAPAPGGYGAPAPGGYGGPAPGGYGGPAPGGYGAPAAGGYGGYGAPAPAPGGYGGAAPAPGGYGGGYGGGAPAPGGYGGGAYGAGTAPPREDYKRPFEKGGQHVLGRDRCPFYHKMGSCRHGDRCTKVHDKPTSSRTIVLPMMYPNPKVVPLTVQKGGRAVQLEYDRKMLKKHIETFYEDVFCTVMEFGRIVEMRVIDNLCEHLLGNVYIKFGDEFAAQNAVDGLNGKMYNGILLLPELCPVGNFADAICKEVDDSMCKRGIQCNYWHPTPYPRPDSSLIRDLAQAQEAHWARVEKKRDRSTGRDDSPARQQHRPEEGGEPAAGGGASDALCHICGRLGHVSKDCPMKE